MWRVKDSHPGRELLWKATIGNYVEVAQWPISKLESADAGQRTSIFEFVSFLFRFLFFFFSFFFFFFLLKRLSERLKKSDEVSSYSESLSMTITICKAGARQQYYLVEWSSVVSTCERPYRVKTWDRRRRKFELDEICRRLWSFCRNWW